MLQDYNRLNITSGANSINHMMLDGFTPQLEAKLLQQ
jgi:hypothetical protein